MKMSGMFLTGRKLNLAKAIAFSFAAALFVIKTGTKRTPSRWPVLVRKELVIWRGTLTLVSLLSCCCHRVHYEPCLHQSLNGRCIFSQVKLWSATLQHGLWAAVDDIKPCMTFATLRLVMC